MCVCAFMSIFMLYRLLFKIFAFAPAMMYRDLADFDFPSDTLEHTVPDLAFVLDKMQAEHAVFDFASDTLEHAVPDLAFVLDWMEQVLAVFNFSSDTWTYAVGDFALTANVVRIITLVSSAAPVPISPEPSFSSSVTAESIADVSLEVNSK